MNIRLIILSVIFLAASVNAATVVDPSDVNLQYTGRWDQSNPNQPWAYAKGTSIIAKFKGTDLSGTFSTTSTDYLRIIIDDQASDSRKIPVSSSNVSYHLAADLPDTEHKIEIVKETDAGRWTFHGFKADGDLALVTPPPRPQRKLVFYGDSNLAGDSLEHEQNQSDQRLRGSYYGYAGIVSRMFGAEYSNISRSGASIRSLNASFDRIDWYTPGSSWDFDKFQPDAVIINVGANDVGRPEAKIKKDYNALLDDMRIAYPNAHIMLYNAWGWDYDEPANYIDEVIVARDDDNMSYATFPWVFEQWHGCEYDHSGMAHVLANHIEKILGWVPAPADVMSGYGTGGNVANGGFEKVAPFGGYGWRYYTDEGVSRVEDPGVAYEGEYFLRLSDAAATHQPNPALDGETFTVEVRMRGASNGDQVFMTIDFRDQEMWTEPLQTSVEAKVLTTEWAPYSMSATAPSGTSNPVFHTRLTFQAGIGSIVDIDDIVMSLDAGGAECTDNDGDGYGDPGSAACENGSATDCNDDIFDVNPGASEICGNDLDDDCNGLVDYSDPACPAFCADIGASCRTDSDCCSENCSKGKPSSRICLHQAE